MEGTVKDTAGAVLPYANIKIECIDKEGKPHFGITDEKGFYRFNLPDTCRYRLVFSYLGYRKDTVSIEPGKSIVRKDAVLVPVPENLNDVVIEIEMPVRVKEDTVVYKAEAFTTGDERKLKDVLKKLPGVEVEKNGQIKVMGKTVNKVMIEGKDFFGGGTKLAVENIPADVIDKIEAIDDYHSVPFMKGVEDKNRLILNIRLKKGKEKFMFGDITAGAGIKEKYVVKPSVFYYSPEQQFHLLGNINNTGENALSVNDFIELENASGDMKDWKNSLENYLDLMSFFGDKNFYSQRSLFGAVQWQRDWKNSKINAYTIGARVVPEYYKEFSTTYLPADLTENSRETTRQESTVYFSKLHYRYSNGIRSFLDVEMSGSFYRLSSSTGIYSQTSGFSTTINKTYATKLDRFKTQIQWHKRYNRRFIVRWQWEGEIQNETPEQFYRSDRIFPIVWMTFVNDSIYRVEQEIRNKRNYIFTEGKLYYIINRKNHVYFSLSGWWSRENFLSGTYQILDDQTVFSFRSQGFYNDTQIHFSDAAAQITYKHKLTKSSFIKTAIGIHRVWRYFHFSGSAVSYAYVEPLVALEKTFSRGKKLQLEYRLQMNYLPAERFAPGFRVKNYHSVEKGNPELRDPFSHRWRFVYRDFKTFKGISWSVSVNYAYTPSPVVNYTEYREIAAYSYPVISEYPVQDGQLSGMMQKYWKKIYFRFIPRLQIKKYTVYTQNQWVKWQSWNTSAKWEAGTLFRNFPNFIPKLYFRRSVYRSGDFSGESYAWEPGLEIYYDFGHYLVSAEVMQVSFNDWQSQRYHYYPASLQISYWNDNSPWGWEIEVKNVFNQTLLVMSHSDETVIRTQYMYVMPASIIFKVVYKL